MSGLYSAVVPVISTVVADSEVEAMARLAAALVSAGFEIYRPGNDAELVSVGACLFEAVP